VSELRLKSLEKLGTQLLSDLPGYEEVGKKLTSSIREIERHKQELVDTWVKYIATL
jgi:hypothetical protein